MNLTGAISASWPQFLANIKYAWPLAFILGAIDAYYTKKSLADAVINYALGLIGVSLGLCLLQYSGSSPIFGEMKFSTGVLLCVGCWISIIFGKFDLKNQILGMLVIGAGTWLVDATLRVIGFYAKGYKNEWGISTLYFLIVSALVMCVLRTLRKIEMKEATVRMLVSIFVLCVIIGGIYIMQDTVRSIVLAIVMIITYPILLGIVLRPETIASGDIKEMYTAGVKNIPVLGKLLRPLPDRGSDPAADS